MSVAESTSEVVYRAIEGFPGYRVGDDGSVWSCKNGEWTQRRPSRMKTGYLSLPLSNNGHKRTKYVHHLVLEAFVGPRPDGTQCCHENGIAWDNRLENLRWDTAKGNYLDRSRHGTGQDGAQSHRAKLTEDQVREIYRRRKSGEIDSVIAKDYGITASAVTFIELGKSWRCLELTGSKKLVRKARVAIRNLRRIFSGVPDEDIEFVVSKIPSLLRCTDESSEAEFAGLLKIQG